MKKLIGCLVLGGALLCPTEAGIAQSALDKGYEYRHSYVNMNPCGQFEKEEIRRYGKPKRAACYRIGNDLKCYKKFLDSPKRSMEELEKGMEESMKCFKEADMRLLSTNNDGIYDAVKVLKGSPCEKCHSRKVKI